MIYLDTNTLVRYLVRDNPDQADKVVALLTTEKNIKIVDHIILECSFVLKSVYQLEKDKIVEGLSFLLKLPNIKTSLHIKNALELYSRLNISFYDALLLALLPKNANLASFDRKLLKVAKLKPII
ncbi:MAG: PIN domain-containing protein [bacterium]|nr:PIN domain-containing protein [bacterium]